MGRAKWWRLAGVALLLACAPGVALAAGDEPVVAAVSGPVVADPAEPVAAAGAERALQGSIEDFRRALLASLAASDAVDAVLTAALVAENLEFNSTRESPAPLPKAQASDALFARLAQLAPDHPAVQFALATRACGRRGHCAADAARARLREIDPDNAATWLLEFGRQSALAKKAEARAALLRAAQASAYRDYADELALRQLRVLLADPTQLSRLDPAMPQLDAAAQTRMVKMLDADMALGIPPHVFPLARACDPAGEARGDLALQAACRTIGALEAAPGSSWISQTNGVLLQWRLARDDAERVALDARRTGLRDLSAHLRAEHDWARWLAQEIDGRLAGVGDVERRRRELATHAPVPKP
jgi:hypothetical protein